MFEPATAEKLYGQTYHRSTPETKLALEDAVKTLNMAMRSENPNMQARALSLAATKEMATFG